MENNIIKEILEDIYLIDSDLRKNENQLIKIIKELIKAKPEAKFDKAFASSLRQEVLEKVRLLEDNNNTTFNLFNFNFMKKQLFVGGGVLAVLVLVVVFFSLNQNSSIIEFTNDSVDLKSKITRLDGQAFGSVGAAVETNLTQERSLDTAVGMGGGGGTYATSEAKMIMPSYYYDYVYVGEDFEIPSLGDVYRKVISESSGKALAQKFSLDLGLLDLRKFKNTSLMSFNISEDREFGYQIYFNSFDNIVSINQNWETWPDPTKDCRDDACFESYKLTIDDIPSDAEIIAIAKQGIQEYGIDISMYGEPRVNQNWRKSYDAEEDKSQVYIPDTISVIYPLMLDGQEVTEDYGYGVGINVGVNVRYNKVSSITNIALNDFEVSSYSLEQDAERIIKFAEQGGLYSRYYINEESDRIEIQLGTPKLGLIANWKYNEETGRGENYYIPAMIFPIVNETDNIYYSRQVISIPLIPEVLDRADDANNNPQTPMPLLRIMEDDAVVDEEVPMIKEEVAPMLEPMLDDMSVEVMSR